MIMSVLCWHNIVPPNLYVLVQNTVTGRSDSLYTFFFNTSQLCSKGSAMAQFLFQSLVLFQSFRERKEERNEGACYKEQVQVFHDEKLKLP